MNFHKQFGSTTLFLAGAVFLAGCSNNNNPMKPDAIPGRGIYVMNADGTNHTFLTQGGEHPSWRGNRITFSRGSPREIYVMNSDGSNRARLTNDVAWEFSPSWSPDGSKLAYNYGSSALLVMNADGTNQTGLGSGYSPDWSPDGTRIAYGGDTVPGGGIYVMSADGSNRIPLTSNSSGEFDDEPAWSPDGSKIAFARSTGLGGSLTQILVMNADGSNLIILTGGTTVSCSSPCWSPDGSRIAFFRSN